MNKEIWEYLYDLKCMLSDICVVIYNLALTDSGDDTYQSVEIWKIKKAIDNK